MKTISIVIPVYNEAKNIVPCYTAIRNAILSIEQRYIFEFLFIDDGSTDTSLAHITDLVAYDYRVRSLQFSRNFGKEVATTAGLHYASGDAVIMIDADLQHPAFLIPRMITLWEQGAEIVTGIRERTNGESIIKQIGSKFFYRVINIIAEHRITPNATDFRLLDRSVVNEFNKFTERNRITRGLIDWLGFKQAYVAFSSPPRINGTATYSTLKLVKLAISSVVAHSLFPLKFAGYLGVIITFTSGILGLFILIEQYILPDPLGLNFSGPAILAVIIVFLIGIVLSCLGLIALYIAQMHHEIRNRPMYVVKSRK